jgi:hypothetical protein
MDSRQRTLLIVSILAIVLALGAVGFFLTRGSSGEAVKVAPGAPPPPGASEKDNETGGAPPEALKGGQ